MWSVFYLIVRKSCLSSLSSSLSHLLSFPDPLLMSTLFDVFIPFFFPPACELSFPDILFFIQLMYILMFAFRCSNAFEIRRTKEQASKEENKQQHWEKKDFVVSSAWVAHYFSCPTSNPVRIAPCLFFLSYKSHHWTWPEARFLFFSFSSLTKNPREEDSNKDVDKNRDRSEGGKKRHS